MEYGMDPHGGRKLKSNSGWVDDFHNREKTDTFKGKFLWSVFNVNVPGGKPYFFPYLLGRGWKSVPLCELFVLFGSMQEGLFGLPPNSAAFAKVMLYQGTEMSDSWLRNRQRYYSKDSLNRDKPVADKMRELRAYSVQGKCWHQVERLFLIMQLKAASRSWLHISKARWSSQSLGIKRFPHLRDELGTSVIDCVSGYAMKIEHVKNHGSSSLQRRREHSGTKCTALEDLSVMVSTHRELAQRLPFDTGNPVMKSTAT